VGLGEILASISLHPLRFLLCSPNVAYVVSSRTMANDRTKLLACPKHTAEKCLELAESLEASSTITGCALYWLKRIARQWAWELYHADNKRGRFHVEESTVIRGREVSVCLFIDAYGHVYSTRWRVDGHAWTFQQINQSFGF